jgi:osmotically-inducible protein OsmY
MERIKAFLLTAVVGGALSGALAGCGSTTERTVTTTYVPPVTTQTTTTYAPAPVPQPELASKVVTTVTTNSDGTVRRTTTRYYAPGTTRTYVSVDDQSVSSEVRTALHGDPEVSAHARNVAVSTDAGTVEIVGTADSISTVQQASWDALQIPGVQVVNNDMRIDPTSPG